MIYHSSSSAQTKKLGGEVAAALVARPPHKSHAAVVALKGDLGAGKTTFTQGFLRTLGIKAHITSPTFVLMKNYKIKSNNFSHVFHADWYRLSAKRELNALGFKQILANPKNIILIEWPERIPRALPSSTIRIHFRHGETENERQIHIGRLFAT